MKILVINPGSTSTKIAVYKNEKKLNEQTIRHSSQEISKFNSIIDQVDFRKVLIYEALEKWNISPDSFKAVIARGGLLRPIEGGIYNVNKNMLDDLKSGEYGMHASNLGALIAVLINKKAKVFIADPVVVDELDSIARLSGHPDHPRVSIFHALNQKAIANEYASKINKKYNELNLIVAHLGGGITVGAHKRGRVVDVNNGLSGDGPFSPERPGTLPFDSVIKKAFSGEFSSSAAFLKSLIGKSGLVAYLNTNDVREVEKMIEAEDKNAELILKAMAYQISKEIASLAAVLKGDVDAILITGGVAYSKFITNEIKNRISFISKVEIFPGEDELKALALIAHKALKNNSIIKEY